MLVDNHNMTIVKTTVPKCIKIRSNVELPPALKTASHKYEFITTLEVGESFEVNGDTPDYKPKSLASGVYQVASRYRKTTDKTFKVACRTIEGTSSDPIRSACWRVA
jgi:hypothetical protein